MNAATLVLLPITMSDVDDNDEGHHDGDYDDDVNVDTTHYACLAYV